MIPFEKYIPKFFTRDNKLLAMSNKIDENLISWKTDVIGLKNNINPVMIDSKYINELGYLVNAGILPQDSDFTKRNKVATAIKTHKNRGTWIDDVKLKIDASVGEDSKLVSIVGSDEWIMSGDGGTPTSYFWSILGGDGITDDYGIRLIGESTEEIFKGVVLIDVDSSTLTADEVENLKLNIEDSVPAYFIIYLGYISGGSFVKYSNGQMG